MTGDDRHRQADVADRAQVLETGEQCVGNGAVEQTVSEEQPTGERILEHGGLQKGPENHHQTDKSGNGAGSLGLAFAEEENGDGNPHQADRYQNC